MTKFLHGTVNARSGTVIGDESIVLVAPIDELDVECICQLELVPVEDVPVTESQEGVRDGRPTQREGPATHADGPAAQAEGSAPGFWAQLGPGLIAGASDDDPSGIATCAMAGAIYGYGTLCTAVITYPMMAVIQYICAKIGMVTGLGLADVLKSHYPKKWLYAAVMTLFIANTINAGTDLGAMAAAVNLLVPQLPVWLLVMPITAAILLIQVLGSYQLIARIFKWLLLSLFAYIITAFCVHADFAEVLHNTFMPRLHFDAGLLSMLVALLGTTISPY
ncbi:MAG TPA: divalent metal cation transporter, partial [Ktedonobacteraceae bacterium]|nr:divalent metal cation transporter [Ktedonobacteraceae bacterium]